LLDDPSKPLIHYTPHYLYAPTVPFEIFDFYPQSYTSLRFIIMLRNPVDRALSAYWFQRSAEFTSSGKDEGSIEEFEQLMREEMFER
jgi:hypothetical protein